MLCFYIVNIYISNEGTYNNTRKIEYESLKLQPQYLAWFKIYKLLRENTNVNEWKGY